MASYAEPEVLVSTEWVTQHTGDPKTRLVEVDVDASAYSEGHVPGAIAWSWNTQLCDTVQRDILSKQAFEKLMSDSGVANDSTLVLYGDNNNWFAAWAFWQAKIYGHTDVRIMNGGRKKWLAEARTLVTDAPSVRPTSYTAGSPDLSLRAFLPEVQTVIKEKSAALVDVRSPQEFTGEILAPPGLPETCQRGGHIPGARNITWSRTCNDDGTFKTVDELRSLYSAEGIDGSERGHCLLSNRREVQPYLVCFELSAGIPKRL
jgi:thiosulfate/3-mercaptopyruvate sulfurtransferase